MVQTSSATTNSRPTNNEKVSISRPKELFLLFWIDETEPTVDTTWNPTGHLTGRDFFKEAAQTRLVNLKTELWFDPRIHCVHCPPITHFSEIQLVINNWINKYGGSNKIQMKEVSFFSHGGLDGPIIYNASQHDPDEIFLNRYKAQIKLSEWSKINFSWAQNKQCRLNFFGCNTGNQTLGASKIFAKNVSKNIDSPNIIVSGQTTSSFPSFFPDSRFTSVARSTNRGWNVGPTYMVGGNAGEGKSAILGRIKANKMSFYKDNINGGKFYQSIFNDHRKPRNTTNSPELRRVQSWQTRFK